MASLLISKNGNGASSSKQTSSFVKLHPSPGFVIKSVVTQAGIYAFAPDPSPQPSSANLLEPKAQAKRLVIPKDQKVFLNIAWDGAVPPPPPADEATVRRAMAGADLVDEVGTGTYFVPVVVSEPREEKDKAGKPSLVFDCIFNVSLKSRCTKDPEFKMYILELALEHVETKADIQLSRQIGTPNIASKGKLEPRSALIPNSLLDPSQISAAVSGSIKTRKAEPLLVQEVNGAANLKAASKPKSILKPSSASSPSSGAGSKSPLIQEVEEEDIISSKKKNAGKSEAEPSKEDLPPPRWKWRDDGDRIRVDIEVPLLTHEVCRLSTVDIEARRIIVDIPKQYYLDINLDQPDSEIARIQTGQFDKDDRVVFGMGRDAMQIKGQNAGEAMRLKRARELDVDKARAQWTVDERRLVIWL